MDRVGQLLEAGNRSCVAPKTSRLQRPVCAAARAVEGVSRNQAVRRSLEGLPIYHLGGGHAVVPLFQAKHDNLPFALALELRSSCAERDPLAAPVRPADQGLELRYVLDGWAHLLQSNLPAEELRAGDSLLMPTGLAHRISPQRTEQDADWQMACLTLHVGLLPEAGEGSTQHGSRIVLVDEAVAERVTQRWLAAPSVGTVSPATVGRLLAGARESAVRTFGRTMTPAQVLVRRSRTGSTPGDEQGSWNNGNTMVEKISRSSTSSGSSSTAAARPSSWEAGGGHKPRIVKRTLNGLGAFQLPNQTNRLVLLFDPLQDEGLPFTFGVEIFERGHKTTPHTHEAAHEVFFILAGAGEAFCNGERFAVQPGDAIVFPPTSVHGIDNGEEQKLYVLELMFGEDMFAEFVRNGQPLAGLLTDDLCVLMALGCAG